MWPRGSKGIKSLSDRRTSRAQALGFVYGAPKEVNVEVDNELYSKEHGNKAYEVHRSGDFLFSALRHEGDLKLRELMQAKKRAPSTPTPPNSSRNASSPEPALFPPESPPLPRLRGAASKTTKTRRQSSCPRKTHDQSLLKVGVFLPLADPPSLPDDTPVSSPTTLEGSPGHTKWVFITLLVARSYFFAVPFLPSGAGSYHVEVAGVNSQIGHC